jgi:endonuclease-3 related protein
MLTQNTNWGNVEKALANIRQKRALNLKRLLELPEEELALLIKPSGYFRLKAKRLKHLLVFMAGAKVGWRAFLRSMPPDEAREKLLAVHGVGPETADSILLYAAQIPSFVIDKYTLRFGVRFGLFHHGTRYAHARELFMESLPENEKLYNEYHALVVRQCVAYCRSKPLCAECPLRKGCAHFQRT